MSDEVWMRRALDLAQEAESQGEVPVGAVLVRDDVVLGEGFNQPISAHDATAHAEIVALRAATAACQNYRLPGSTLYVTLEPCAMCAGALVHARIERVVIAAPEPRAGAGGSVLNVLSNPQLNHRCAVEFGLFEQDSADMLRQFFRSRR